MIRRSNWPRFVVLIGMLLLGSDLSSGQTPVAKTFLLNVSKGQLPSETGQDDKTRPEIVNDIKEIGDKALKVPFAKGDSFGVKVGANTNWKRFVQFRCNAFNPSTEPITLELSVHHARSTNFHTRVAFLFNLKPGLNEVKIGIDEMTNENRSLPDLANVTRWYILDVNQKSPTVYFGDIWLEGGTMPPAPATVAPTGVGSASVAPTGPLPLIGYRVKGRVGSLDIDLSVTPFIVQGNGAVGPMAESAVHGDPARLARIKAAKMPKLTQPISFDTPEADAVLAALEVFPPNNPWNLDVSDWPLHPNSKGIVGSIGSDKPFRYNPDMGFVLVPPDQKKLDVKAVVYPGESDLGPFPLPDNIPIEGWPVEFVGKKVTLDDVQRDTLKQGGDRHAMVIDPQNRMLYEFYQLRKTDVGWQATCTAIFDLKSNKMRPEDWTSTDAAGLPVFPAVVRHDELKRGLVEHAMRLTVVKTRRAYVYPARHFASPLTDENLPRMGERLRLRQNFDISNFSPEMQAILKGLKKYGMYVADNGIDWAISVAPDPRIPVMNEEFRKVKGSDFEVVQPPPNYQPPEE